MSDLIKPESILLIDRPSDVLVHKLLRTLDQSERNLRCAWMPAYRTPLRPTVASLDKHLAVANAVLDALFMAEYLTATDYSRVAAAMRVQRDRALARRRQHLHRSKTTA